MKTSLKGLLITAVVLLLTSQVVFCQQGASMVISESRVLIKGTSSLHDWEVAVKDFDVKLSIGFAENGDILIGDVRARFSGASVESESSLMTSKTHDALQVKVYPFITFSSSDKIKSAVKGGEISGAIAGELLLSGVTQKSGVSFTGRLTGDKIHITGSKKINMTDFGIKPPVAMLGALKTGEEVTVEFDLTFLIVRR